jgi:hypothetical protein
MGPRFAIPGLALHQRSGRPVIVCDSAVTPGGIRVVAERTEGLGKITGVAGQEAIHLAEQRRANSNSLCLFLGDRPARRTISFSSWSHRNQSQRRYQPRAGEHIDRSAFVVVELRPTDDRLTVALTEEHGHHTISAGDVAHRTAVTVDQHRGPLLVTIGTAATLDPGTDNFRWPAPIVDLGSSGP